MQRAGKDARHWWLQKVDVSKGLHLNHLPEGAHVTQLVDMLNRQLHCSTTTDTSQNHTRMAALEAGYSSDIG